MSEWKEVSLGDFCSIGSSKRIFYSEYTEAGVPFWRSKEVIVQHDGGVIGDPLYISEERYAELEKYGYPSEGDLLLTSVGTIGVPYLVKANDRFYFKDGNLTWFKDFSESLDSKFLYLFLESRLGQSRLEGLLIGSSQKALTISALNTLQIPLPPIETQKRIAEILFKYDELIESSRRQIALLEEAAHRLYKEWFVDLRFPGYETTPIIGGLPEGWRKVALGSFIESHIGGGWGSETSTSDFNVEAFVIRATDISNISNGNLSLPLRWHKESNFRIRSLADGDIVFEVSGGSKEIGVGRSMIVSKQFLKALDRPVICASFCKKIRCRSVSDAYLLYEQIQMDLTAGGIRKYEKRSAGNIINFHWEDFLKSYQVIVPDDGTLNLFSIQISCIRKQAENCKMLCMLAKEARDRLLPKLMSGEIEVG